MRPMFAVQVTSRDDAELHKTIEALKQAGLDYETFGVIPFEYEITNLEAFPTDRPVIPLRLPISPPSRGADGGTPTHTPFGRGF